MAIVYRTQQLHCNNDRVVQVPVKKPVCLGMSGPRWKFSPNIRELWKIRLALLLYSTCEKSWFFLLPISSHLCDSPIDYASECTDNAQRCTANELQAGQWLLPNSIHVERSTVLLCLYLVWYLPGVSVVTLVLHNHRLHVMFTSVICNAGTTCKLNDC